MAASSREQILGKLRGARRPFPDAAPRPDDYFPVTVIDNTTRNGLIGRFVEEFVRLKGEAFVVANDADAVAVALDLIARHQAARALAWDFHYIGVYGLEQAIRAAGVEILQPNTHQDGRAAMLAASEQAAISITGADYAIAATGTLIVTTAPGKGRIPTVLAPAHLAIFRASQLLPRLEDWIAIQRADNLQALRDHANVCFISGPSRTGDIEMELILGVHGPGTLYALIINDDKTG